MKSKYNLALAGSFAGAITLALSVPAIPHAIVGDRVFPVTLPINKASGKHVGVIAQLNFFFDDIFPNSLGKPLFSER